MVPLVFLLAGDHGVARRALVPASRSRLL